MNNSIVFEIKQSDGFPTIDDHPTLNCFRGLLTDVATNLEKYGIKCDEIKFGSGCLYFDCKVSNKRISVVIVSALYINQGLPFKCSIDCYPHTNFWKCLLKGRPPVTGAALEKVCGVTYDIINEDSRFGNVQAMTVEEWHNTFLPKRKKIVTEKSVPLAIGLGFWFSWIILLIPIGAEWMRAAIWALLMLICLTYMFRRKRSKQNSKSSSQT